ncbi:ParB/RepB/Spo0J family partition protein [Sphingomonas sp. ASV193]
MITTIPLNKLRRSANNVRRMTDEKADAQLQADIAAHGLLQNLVVTALKKPRGHFAVEAGGRRLGALQRLVKDGTITADVEVPCLILDPATSDAQEASLAENFQRLRMNPADECRAFERLVALGLNVDDIASRFGLARRFVDGRLRLADLAPVVFEALGAGDITLDVAKAFAATSDQDRQAHVYAQMCDGYGVCHPDSIRRLMTQATIAGSDRRARFVGDDAYQQAGGRIERDLFADDETARWLDVELVERLAGEKIAALAEEKRAELGLAFVTPTLDCWIGYRHTEGLAPIDLEATPLSEQEEADVAAYEEMIGGLVERLESEEMPEAHRAECEDRVRQLDAQIDEIENKPPILPDDLKDRLGTFLLLDENSKPRLHRHYYLSPNEDDAASDEDDRPEAAVAGVGEAESAAEPKAPAGLSQRHADELAMQRRDILALHVARDPAVATSLAIFLMADRAIGYRGERPGSTISATKPNEPVPVSQMPDTAAGKARQEQAAALDRSWTGLEGTAERFMAFRRLNADRQAAWLAELVADSLHASLNERGHRECGLHDQLGDLLGIEPAAWWRPTGANYFDRVPKGVSLAALAEVGGPALAGLYAKAKKPELAQVCECLFAGELIVEAEVRDAALSWVPAAMRFVVPPWIGDVQDGVRGVAGGETADAVAQDAIEPEADGETIDQLDADGEQAGVPDIIDPAPLDQAA